MLQLELMPNSTTLSVTPEAALFDAKRDAR